MRLAAISRIESSVDRSAAALFAAGCGYAAYLWLGTRTGVPLLSAELTGIAIAAYIVTFRALSAVEPEGRKAPLSVFDLRNFEPGEEEELLLHEEFESGHKSLLQLHAPEMPRVEFATDELLLDEEFEPQSALHDHSEAKERDEFERAEQLMIEHFAPARAAEEEPLLLDDILAELGPDSRVVRLFDPEAMPTPGQLKSRIDRHLEPGQASHVADASQALHEALDELRRSIR